MESFTVNSRIILYHISGIQ